MAECVCDNVKLMYTICKDCQDTLKNEREKTKSQANEKEREEQTGGRCHFTINRIVRHALYSFHRTNQNHFYGSNLIFIL